MDKTAFRHAMLHIHFIKRKKEKGEEEERGKQREGRERGREEERKRGTGEKRHGMLKNERRDIHR